MHRYMRRRCLQARRHCHEAPRHCNFRNRLRHRCHRVCHLPIWQVDVQSSAQARLRASQLLQCGHRRWRRKGMPPQVWWALRDRASWLVCLQRVLVTMNVEALSPLPQGLDRVYMLACCTRAVGCSAAARSPRVPASTPAHGIQVCIYSVQG